MTDIAWYVALAWVLSTLGAGLACYWLGWRDRGEDDREGQSVDDADRRGPWR